MAVLQAAMRGVRHAPGPRTAPRGRPYPCAVDSGLDHRDRLLHAIQQEVSDDTDPAVVTAFVIVAEYLDGSGELGLITLTDGHSPPHRLYGLLGSACVEDED